MGKSLYFFLVAGCGVVVSSARGESLLELASFPTVAADASFVERMENLKAGYEELNSVYDENGRCISGCAYPGITIEAETAAIERNSQLAYNAANAYNAQNSNIPSYNYSPYLNNVVNAVLGSQPTVYACMQHRNAISTRTPLNSPIDVDIRISSDFGPRKRPTAGASEWHRGIDISVPTGTPVYATADGVVEYIRDQGNSGGGKYVVLKHDGNFRTSYMHLSNNQVLKVGDSVQAGCLVGISGNTGASTGPHLHYVIYYTAPGKQFGWSQDAIDPVWEKNYFGTGYRYKSQGVKSCLHRANGFCGTGAIPPDTLPGEIK